MLWGAMTDIPLLPAPVHLSLTFYFVPSTFCPGLHSLCLFSVLSLHSESVYILSAAVFTLPVSLYIFPLSLSLTIYIASIKILELLRKTPKHISKNSGGKNKCNAFCLPHKPISPSLISYFLKNISLPPSF